MVINILFSIALFWGVVGIAEVIVLRKAYVKIAMAFRTTYNRKTSKNEIELKKREIEVRRVKLPILIVAEYRGKVKGVHEYVYSLNNIEYTHRVKDANYKRAGEKGELNLYVNTDRHSISDTTIVGVNKHKYRLDIIERTVTDTAIITISLLVLVIFNRLNLQIIIENFSAIIELIKGGV